MTKSEKNEMLRRIKAVIDREVSGVELARRILSEEHTGERAKSQPIYQQRQKLLDVRKGALEDVWQGIRKEFEA